MSKIVFGLNNMGNTCYLSSAVQLLCLNPKFHKMENILTNPNKSIKKIKNTLASISSRFDGFSQEDSGEALILLLEHYGKKLKTLSDYEFTEKTRIRCKLMNCLNEEISTRKSNVLLLDINNYDTLDDCYRNQKDSVKLMGDEAWTCPKCDRAAVSSKRFYFENWSPFLIIGLRRFYYRGTRYVKNSNPVKIPLEWRHDYKLRGAIIHSGSLTGGHYICVGFKDDNWYEFNDSSVTKISSRRVLDNYLSKSYFLLYQKI